MPGWVDRLSTLKNLKEEIDIYMLTCSWVLVRSQDILTFLQALVGTMFESDNSCALCCASIRAVGDVLHSLSTAVSQR